MCVVEKSLVKLVGGPMDGYDDAIRVRDDLKELIPGPHHRREAKCRVVPVYVRQGSNRFVFDRLIEG